MTMMPSPSSCRYALAIVLGLMASCAANCLTVGSFSSSLSSVILLSLRHFDCNPSACGKSILPFNYTWCLVSSYPTRKMVPAERPIRFRFSTGCCPNKNSFERSLKRFMLINLSEAEDKRFQLFEPKGRVLKSPEASLRFSKKRFQTSEKGFGQQPVNS